MKETTDKKERRSDAGRRTAIVVCCMCMLSFAFVSLPGTTWASSSVGGGPTIQPLPVQDGGRGLGHPGSILRQSAEGADRPRRVRTQHRPLVGRAVLHKPQWDCIDLVNQRLEI